MSADDVQEDERMEDVAPQAGVEDEDDDGDDGESSEESEAEPVLAVTRSRRVNAGNRMSKLLELAEQEDAQQEEEYGEIFAEVGDDVEFEAAEDEEGDVNMDSSSEDEDAEAGQDDDAGERELKKQERSENKKKRKRESLLQDAMKRAAARVGPKVAPARAAVVSSPAVEARPRKKSERVSWLPEAPEGAVRASSRHLAVQNKSAVHERLKEKEKHRLRTVAIMKAAEKRKEASKPKTLTQEERLEEAARTERMNLKSLNRWEVAEKKRAEEQKARLAALKNHRLEGPIITYYSGPALWINDKLKVVGKEALLPEDKQKKAASEAREEEDMPSPAVQPVASASPQGPDQPITLPIRRSVTPLASAAAHSHPIPRAASPKEVSSAGGFLEGIEEYANGDAETLQRPATPSTHPQTPVSPIGSQGPSTYQTPAQPLIVPYETPYPPYPPSSAAQGQHTGESLLAQFQTTFPVAPPQAKAPPPPPQPKLPPKRELATRILISLHDFPQENINPLKKEPDFIRHHLLDWPLQPVAPTKKAEKALHKEPPSKKAICAVTGQPARYCDPATGLYYVDAVALKSMRWITNSKGKWYPQIGTFAHTEDKMSKGRPAKGVPDMFLMTGEELKKRQEEVKKVREEQERIRAEARAKAQAEAQARAQAQAEALARAQAQAQARIPPPSSGPPPAWQNSTYPQLPPANKLAAGGPYPQQAPPPPAPRSGSPPSQPVA